MAFQQIRDNLYLIDIDRPSRGSGSSSAHGSTGSTGRRFSFDPGPASTIPYLVERLKQAGVDRVDHVLLTHTHPDHAGGTGQLLQHFPDAKVNCHPKGIAHMVAPQRLWEESKKVLGKVAEAYGEMAPVPESGISFRERIDLGGSFIEAIETPGHAPHHVSYRVGAILFAGEIGGVYVPLDEGFYVRPATPPPFRHETFRESIAKAAALDVSLLCLGHYGCRQDGAALFERARRQLDFWVDTVERHFRKGSDPFEESVLADLITNDPDMSGWQSLPKDIQARERNFCFNSIRGFEATSQRSDRVSKCLSV